MILDVILAISAFVSVVVGVCSQAKDWQKRRWGAINRWGYIAIIVGALVLPITITKSCDDNKDKKELQNNIASLDTSNNEMQIKIDSLLTGNGMLSDTLNSIVKVVRTHFPELSREEAIEQLKRDYKQLKTDLDFQKNTIKNIYATLHIVFSGDRRLGELNNTVNYQGSRPAIIIMTQRENISEDSLVRFFPTEGLHFKPVSSNRFEFTSTAQVDQKDFPIGEQIGSLSSYKTIWLSIPFFDPPGNLLGKKIVIERIEVHFSINMQKCQPLIITNPLRDNRPLELTIPKESAVKFFRELKKQPILRALNE